MKLEGYARCALIGLLAASSACARNAEQTDDPNATATGRVTAADTGATIRVRPDTTGADTAQGTSTEGSAAEEPRDTLRPAQADSAGWPIDTSSGGWSTPVDSL